MKTLVASISMGCLLASASVFAEPLDGSRILETEAAKARQLEDLEYKARLIEQKAKLAKAYKQLQENGGYSAEQQRPAYQQRSQRSYATRSSVDKPSAKQEFKLPSLQSISGRYALFKLDGKVFQGAPGGQLPGGFKVLSVNEAEGVRLKHNGNIYTLDIAWSKP